MIRVQIGERQGRLDALGDQLGHRLLEEEALAEIAPQDVADPDGRTAARSAGSRPSFARMSAIWSEVALSPAITAAGSPGVSRSMRKTNTATTARTGMMATRRRAMKSSIPPQLSPRASGGPLDAVPPPPPSDWDVARTTDGGAELSRPRHFFSMFHITGTGAFSQPVTLARARAGSVPLAEPAELRRSRGARSWMASASALPLAGSVSLA